ncbi:hypothetical protein [Nocardioides marmoraquaticus]
MRTTTRLARIAALPLAATLLVACGGGDSGSSSSGSSDDASPEASGDSSYCQELEQAQDSFAAFDSADPQPEQLQEAFDTFKQLADDAPAEVEPEWQTISGAVETLETSLDSIGLEIGDLTTLQQGQVPEGVTQQDLQKVAADLQGLANPEFAEAGQKIQEHAQSECDIDLGGGAGESPSPSPSES